MSSPHAITINFDVPCKFAIYIYCSCYFCFPFYVLVAYANQVEREVYQRRGSGMAKDTTFRCLLLIATKKHIIQYGSVVEN